MVSQWRTNNSHDTVHINCSLFCSSAPLSSVLTNRFGFQLVVMTGGLLIFSGVIATTFTTSVNQIYFTYGLITGTYFPKFTLSFFCFIFPSFQETFGICDNKNGRFCTGMGYCLTFLPSVTILSQYFTRRRALVTAVASTGESVVMSVLAPGEYVL